MERNDCTMKKLLALLLAAMLLCLSAGAMAEAANAPIAKEDLKIGVLHINDSSDQGYTYNHEAGYLKAMEELGLDTETQYVPKYHIGEDDKCATAIQELIEAGCNIIFATSYGHGPYVLEAATQHPEVQFCHATGELAVMAGLPNLHNYFAQIEEARYLAGIAAGLNTKVNKLGYVGAKPFAEVISGFTAFFLGARSVNPDVTMEVIYTNEWSSATLEAQAAQALIDMGCDVISQHSDTTSPATTAEAGGVLHVGYNNDMIPAAPNASLISARIDWSHYMKYALECMMSGEPIATDWTQGWAERTVYLSPLNTAIAAEGTQEAIDAAAAKFDDGSLHVWQGPLYDSEGNPAQIMSWDGSSVVYTFSDEVYEEPNSAPQFNAIIEGIHINE